MKTSIRFGSLPYSAVCNCKSPAKLVYDRKIGKCVLQGGCDKCNNKQTQFNFEGVK